MICNINVNEIPLLKFHIGTQSVIAKNDIGSPINNLMSNFKTSHFEVCAYLFKFKEG